MVRGQGDGEGLFVYAINAFGGFGCDEYGRGIFQGWKLGVRVLIRR